MPAQALASTRTDAYAYVVDGLQVPFGTGDSIPQAIEVLAGGRRPARATFMGVGGLRPGEPAIRRARGYAVIGRPVDVLPGLVEAWAQEILRVAQLLVDGARGTHGSAARFFLAHARPGGPANVVVLPDGRLLIFGLAAVA
jgi:hypothetical protein